MHLRVQRKHHVGAWKGDSTHRPRKENTEETQPVDAMISELQLPELGRLTSLWFKPPGLRCSVLAAVGNGHRGVES